MSRLTLSDLKRRFSILVDVAATLDGALCALIGDNRKGSRLNARGLEVYAHQRDQCNRKIAEALDTSLEELCSKQPRLALGPADGLALLLTPTPHLTTLNGQPVRLWRGVTGEGLYCHVYVAAIAAAEIADTAALDRVLSAIPSPEEAVVPMWRLSPARRDA